MATKDRAVGAFVRLAKQNHIGDLSSYRIDGPMKEMRARDIVWPVVVSPDYHRIVHLAKRNDTITVFVDGVEQETFRWVNEDSVVFSPNGKRYAYVGLQPGGYQTVVVDGVKHTPHPYIWELSLSFSLDSKHVRYEYATKLPNEGLALARGVMSTIPKQLSGGLVRAVIPSPFRPGTEVVLVIDGEEVSRSATCSIRLSAKGEDSWPRSRGEYYPLDLGHDVASADGEWVCRSIKENYASRSIETRSTEGDTTIGPVFDKIMGIIVFDSSVRFHYIARRGQSHYLVEECLQGVRFDLRGDFQSQIEAICRGAGLDLASNDAITIHLSHPDLGDGRRRTGCVFLQNKQWVYSTNDTDDIDGISASHPVLLVACRDFSRGRALAWFTQTILPTLFPDCSSRGIVLVHVNTRRAPEMRDYLHSRNLPAQGCSLLKDGLVVESKSFRGWIRTRHNQAETIRQVFAAVQ